MKNQYYPHLASPITINGVTFKNRIFGAPMSNPELDPDCHMRKEDIAFHENRAKGGLASVAIGLGIVDPVGRTHTKEITLYDVMSLPSLKEVTNAMHHHNCMAVMELAHGGKYANARGHGQAAEHFALGPNDETNPDGLPVRAMTEENIYHAADAFANAAKLVKEAGFDMVLIHGGHGWLLGQFMSPSMNHRTDQWGGSLENRMRFPLLVIEKIREAVGPHFPIEYRMSGAELIQGGYGIDEGVEMAKLLDGKVDLIHVSAGLDTEEAQAVHTHPTMFLPHGVNVHYAAAIKAAGVKTPVVTLGGITTPELAEQILAEGKADVIAMARASIADPHFPDKARHGHPEDIVPCLRCLDCLTGLHAGNQLSCADNCRSAQEARFDRMSAPAKGRRKVLVVGGGPGGMMAAATAAKRGHDVTLAEQSGKLGGLLKFTDYDELKIDLMRLKDYLITQVDKSGAKVLLDTTVTPDFIKDGGYDAVILAVGSSPARPPIPGLDDPSVEHATTVYTKLDQVGKRVAVLGGGLVGCETGLFLADRGHQVTIIEMQSEIAPEANWMHKEGMMQAFAKAPITARTGLRVSRLEPGKGVYAVNGEGAEEFIPADTIVYAMGMRPNTQTVEALRDACLDTVCVGDCVRARKARQAMEEGYWAAVNLA